jgi:diguanylate cyclase (GGDEF)-like protein
MYSGNEVGRHVSNTLLRLALEHAEQVGGSGTMAEIVEQAGEDRPLAEVLDDSGWSSYGQFRRLLEATADVLGGVEPLAHVDESADMASGSMPSATEMLQLLGSPHALFEALGNKGGAVTFAQLTTEQTGPSEWLLGVSYQEGFEPYAALCALNVGMYRVLPRLFGYTKTEVVEETCLLRGDDTCRFRVSWDDGDEAARQQLMLQQRVSVLERRLEQFQDTVADLVLAGDLETALERVVASVALSVRAPGFVLAIYPIPGLCRSVYAHGVDPDEAARVAALVLAGEPCPEVGEQVVDITSIRHRYGRLAVYDPQGDSFDDAATLAAYSRLAATALDSASATEDTRREVARGRALLELSGALAEITTIEAMAASLARATTTVTGADRALVSIADRQAGTVRVVASHGYPAPIAAQLASFEAPINADVLDDIFYLDDTNLPAYGYTSQEAPRAAKHVVVPISGDGEIAGWLTASVVDDPARLAPSADLEARLRGLAAQASTAMRNAQLVEQIRHQALHDALTGLPNRALILDRAEQLLARAQRDHTPVSALFVDLDGFKEINDTLGHAAGDQLLRAVTNRLSEVVRHSDTLGRLGGDEFVVLVDGLDAGIGPDVVAERLLDVLREPFTLEDRPDTTFTVTASIGIATAANHTTAGDLLRHADVALYQAKAAGKNRCVMFAPAMQTAVRLHNLVNLGKALGPETLAGGIEDDDQRRSLQGQDCDSGQGFLLAYPLTTPDLGAAIGVTVTPSMT